MKLKIKDTVVFKKKCIDEHCRRIVEWYAVPGGEINESSLLDLHFWITHKLNKTRPVGKIIGFNDEGMPRVSYWHNGQNLDHHFEKKSLDKVKSR